MGVACVLSNSFPKHSSFGCSPIPRIIKHVLQISTIRLASAGSACLWAVEGERRTAAALGHGFGPARQWSMHVERGEEGNGILVWVTAT